MSELQRVVSWFYRLDPFEDVREFDVTASSAVVEVLGKSLIEVESYLEKNVGRFWNALLKSQDVDRRQGRTVFLRQHEGAGRKFQWLPYEHSVRSRFRRRLEARSVMLRSIDGMSSREYEALGCVSLGLLGNNSRFRLTPSGNEGGADFYAVINNPGACHIFFGANNPVRIIGQTKKYMSPIEVGEVRDFITTIDEVKKHSPATERYVPAWFRSASGPLIGWLIGHAGAQSGALSKAQSHGVVVSDSVDIAELCALSRRLQEYSPASERAGLLGSLVRKCIKDEFESLDSELGD